MRWIVPFVLLLVIGCDRHQQLAPDPRFQIKSRVVFTQPDHKTPREALPVKDFRLSFPLIAGELYGPASTEDFVRPKVTEDYSFAVDFNSFAPQVERAIKAGNIAGGRVKLDPPGTRFGRIATFTMDPQLQKRVGFTVWMDATDSRGLILAYFDRPCSAKGAHSDENHTTRYDVVVPRAGFVWLRRMQISENAAEVTVVDQPSELRLTVAPLREAP